MNNIESNFEKIEFDNKNKSVEKIKTRNEVTSLGRKYKRKIVERLTPLTDSGLEEYGFRLGFTPEDIRNKTILDVGSGRMELFAQEAEKYDARVFSINPKLKRWYIRKLVQGILLRDPQWQKHSIVARGQELPFKPEVFDMATALYSIYPYLGQEERMLAIKELLEVVKPGGKIFIAPHPKDHIDFFGNDGLEWLRKNGFVVSDQNNPSIIITKP